MNENDIAVFQPLIAGIIERLNKLDSRISNLEKERAIEKIGRVPLKGNILYKDKNDVPSN